MTFYMVALACAVGAYLVGGIPVGLILGLFKGVDVRRFGSGNIGAMNVGRVLGRAWGLAVFAIDALKGFVPTLVAGGLLWRFGPPSTIANESGRAICWLAVGLCAVLGHNFSPFLRFRGGKGVSTSLGVALAIYPFLTFPALGGLGIWVVGMLLTRMSSVGSLAGGLAFPVLVIVMNTGEHSMPQLWPYLAFALAVSGLVVIRHRANIARILTGTEARAGV